jgi:threonine/homoserine/homoserine lactone efflux protein
MASQPSLFLFTEAGYTRVSPAPALNPGCSSPNNHHFTGVPVVVYFLVSGLTLGFSAAFTPGPFQPFLLNQTSSFGWKKTLPTAFAPLISDGPIIILLVFLLAQTPDWFLNGLFIAGGLFILYLAKGAYNAYRQFEEGPEGDIDLPQTTARRLTKAALINALSPGPWIFWSLIAGPIFLEGWRGSPIYGVSFMLGFYSTLIGGNLFFIGLFASAERYGRRLKRGLVGVSALALLVFGLYQLYRGAMAFI